ncbi:nitroreductase family protein [Aquihabitans sp. McL0605]|uniref:nitroreductase family protein n=1 Tax=Aquihabitans sp. McL0605 TaxID=3415671 RepID=UPI003CF7C23B
MDLREALYTTRAMRRVSDEPIPQDVQARILDAAVRAPSGGNAQNWRFLIVDDPDVKAKLGPIYRECMELLWTGPYAPRIAAAAADPESEESKSFGRVRSSAQHLADHFEGYPMLLFGFAQYDPSGGSIYPAIWNAMLAARGEGVGAALTSVLAFKLGEVLGVLGVPTDEGWNMAACVTFGYPTGRWGVAARTPVEDVSFRNQWGRPLGFEVAGPLWP